MSWKVMKLAECCNSIADGDHQPPPKAEKGIPFVTIANIKSNHFDFSDTMFVPEEYYDKLDTKRKAQIGDVLYSVVGSFGIPVYIKEDKKFVFQRHIAILRPNPPKLVPRFLYYTMLNRDFYLMADAVAIGAAQRTVSLTALRNMEISVPPIEIQEKIVSALSAYDDLIENNQKQIKLLEEAAQRLYKEWFVDLRFPGYENVPIVDGVPERWEICLLGDLVAINAESITKQYQYNYIDYVDLGSVNAGHINETTRYEMPNVPGRAKRIAYDGDTIWGMVRPNLRSYALVLHPTDTQIFSTGFAVISPKTVPFTYVYCLVTQDSFVGYLINCTNGAAYPAVKPSDFENATVLKPTDELLRLFHKSIEPFYRKIELLDKLNFSLKEARDRLLPKLMSGEEEHYYRCYGWDV